MKFLAFWYLAFLAAFFVALPPGVAEGGAGLAGRDSGKKTKGKAKKKPATKRAKKDDNQSELF